jgi:hypothetical protein
MTTDELKKKCEERAKMFQQAMESCHSSSPMDCIEWFADRIAEFEAQIEKMKCCANCKHQCSFLFQDEIDCANNGLPKWEINEK